MKTFNCRLSLLVGLLGAGTLTAYDFEYDAGDIEGEKDSTGITYTLSVSKGDLGTSYDFDTKEGVTSGSPTGIDINVSSGGATGTKAYPNDSLPTANFTISMNGKLIPPSGGSGTQPTWGASGNAKAPFYIKSNHDNGAKDITVAAGTSVTYTAYEGNSSKSSNWTVNGQTKNNESSIIFSRNWWDVPGWFSASMGTPNPGVYNISASPTDNSSESDDGKMTIVGIGSISGEGKTSTKNTPSELTNSETIWVDLTTADSITLTANIAPSGATWPDNTPEWDASCGFWCLLGDHFIGDTMGKTNVNLDTSSPDVITVSAECGLSKKWIKVISWKIDIKDGSTSIIDQENNIIVGKKISLVGDFQPESIIESFSWTIPGKKIKDYSATTTSAQITQLTDNDSKQKSISYYWIDGGENYEVKFHINTGIKNLSAKTTYHVKIPTTRLAVTNGNVAISSVFGHLEMHYGNYNAPGISFSRTATIPAGFSGDFQYWQRVDSTTRRRQKNDGSWMKLEATNALDTHLPYAATATADDSPGVPLSGSYKKATASDSFTMWLMFKPTGSDSIWVPLRSVSWGWSGTAVKNDSGEWSLENQNTYTGNCIVTTNHPTWNSNIASYAMQPE